MAEIGVARAGRWYWLRLAPRSFYRGAVVDPAYAALCVPGHVSGSPCRGRAAG